MPRQCFYLISHSETIGNVSEYIFYALLKAERLNKKACLIRKRVPFIKHLKAIFFFTPLQAIYKVRSELIASPSLASAALSVGVGMAILFSHIAAAAKYMTCKLINKAAGRPLLVERFQSHSFSRGLDDLYCLGDQTATHYSESSRLYWREALSRQFNITLPPRDETLAKTSLRQLGLGEDSWYVCLHVRTSAFYKDLSSDFRNSNIENYREAIEYIISLGGKVVRLGDQAPMPFAINGFIDYPNTPAKNEATDLYLIKHCRFFIGTNSGLFDTALLFGKPVLSVNTTDFIFATPYKQCDSFIYKRIYCRQEKRLLSFQEVFEAPDTLTTNIDFASFNTKYEYVENTSEDIRNATANFVANLEYGRYDHCAAQNAFSTCHKSAVLASLGTSRYFLTHAEQAQRVFTKSNYNGAIDRSFAEKYFYA